MLSRYSSRGCRCWLTSILLSSLASLLLTLGVSDAQAQIPFTPPVGYNILAPQQGIATGDLSGDGLPDIVASTSEGVAVLINKGDGTFMQSPALYRISGIGVGVVVADFNGDGLPDVAVAGGGGIGILLNTGNGGALGPVTYYQSGTGLFQGHLAAGDFYRSGRNDLALTEQGFLGCCFTLTTFRNQVNGTFVKAVQQHVDTVGGYIVSADVNVDGYPDLVITNLGKKITSVFLNRKDGTFAPPQNYANLTGAANVAAGDLNGDGKPDLVIWNGFSSFAAGIHLNNGEGTFAAPVYYDIDYTSNQLPRFLALADFDGDGKQDIAAYVGYAPVQISIVPGRGDGTFSPATTTIPIPLQGNSTIGTLAAADLDGNGAVDLVAGDKTNNDLFVTLNQRLPLVNLGLRLSTYQGGNTGSVTVTIFGQAFISGGEVRLACSEQPDIIGSGNKIGAGGTSLTTTFRLTGATPGQCHVVITQPNGPTVTVPQPFTIVQGGAPGVWLDLIGWSVLRGGAARTYYINYGNRGNVDAGLTRFWISFPSYLTWQLPGGQRPSPLGRTGGNTFLAFDVTALPAGATGIIPVKLKAPDDPDFAHRIFEIRTWIESPQLETTQPFADAQVLPEWLEQADGTLNTTFGALQNTDGCGSKTCGGENIGAGVCRPLDPIEDQEETQTRSILTSIGITVNNDKACPTGVSFQAACSANCRCTSVRGLHLAVIYGLEALRREADVPVEITGGTECGHQDAGHMAGTTVDLAPTPLASYIMGNPNYQRTGDVSFCGDGLADPKWLSPSGAEYIFECKGRSGAHWHVRFPFDSTKFLDVQKGGSGSGLVVSDPRGVQCGENCSARFTKGLIVKLRAMANLDDRFVGWEGDIVPGFLLNEAEVKVEENKTITARFVKRPAPPDNDPCWTWNPIAGLGLGGWVWHCSDDPQGRLGTPPPLLDDGCWDWFECAIDQPGAGCRGGWVIVPCPDCDSDGLNAASATMSSISGESCELSKKIRVEIVTSNDPNEKVGSHGVGTERWLSGEEPLRYSIFFENKPTATAPAQDVVVTDQLDQTTLDLTTLSLGSITFTDKAVTPQAGLPLVVTGQFNADVDLRPANNLIVRVNATLNQSTNVLTWRFTSIDPATGQPPEDPLAGFLPPGAGGSVFFTVMPKKGLSTGTAVRNKATIVFDVNPPLDTPEWSNALDNARPTSRVLPLAANQNSATFNVKWAGTDEGAGIRDFTVYVSDNGGPFMPWLTQTAAIQAAFTGVPDHTYSFFSVVRDLTGNLEDAKNAAEATTRVVVNRSPVARAKNITVAASGSCQASISPQDIDDRSFDPDGDAVVLTLAPSGPFTLGAHAVTLTATDSHGVSDSISATVTVIDQTPPTMNNVSVSPAIIWPPNGRMIDAFVRYDAADNCGQTFSRLSVHSNETLEPSDVEIVDPHVLRLRASRRGTGNGRTYKIIIFAMDGYGNLSSQDVLIRVPHDQRK